VLQISDSKWPKTSGEVVIVQTGKARHLGKEVTVKGLFKVALVVLVVLLLIVPLLSTACGKEEIASTSTPTSVPTATKVATPTLTQAAASPTPTKVATPTPTQAGATVVEVPIGVLAMTTGSLAAAGTAAARQVELAVEDINKTGFMVGNTLCKFKLVIDDYGYDAAKAVTVVRKHILQDKVKFEMVLGSAGIPAAQPFTEEAGVLLFTGGEGSNYIGPKYPLSFNPAGCYETKTPVCMKYLVERFPSAKKLYYATVDLELTRTTTKTVTMPALQYLGYNVVGQEFYPYTMTDFYPLIDRILAAKPDIVLDAANQVLTKQLRDRGFKGIINEAGTVVPESFSKFVGGSPYTDLVFYPAINERDPSLPAAMQDFVTRYNARWGEYPQGGSFYVVTALYSLAQAMTLAGTYTEPKKVALALESGRFSTPLGEMDYSGAELFGVNHMAGPPTVFNEFINGVATVVMSVPADEALNYMKKIYDAMGGKP
jgi:branched-chain amino acid transport system substrate-binding protein